jgi:crotonobetainyl-CoA:carnitine CoA-transferase CaiB-like acyl-CoA transferase
MFAAHARSKLGVTLDIRTALGRETFLRLAERCDVFVENNSARVLDHLGIGWDVLHARNPRLIVVRMAPLGLSGPYRDFIGFGAHFEALCGFTASRGYVDADPTLTWATFHMDPATGAAGAFAVLAALRQREATGEGELIEFAQAENMVQHLGELYVDASRTGRAHGPTGNRDPNRVPQGCYRCIGEDAWVVASVGDDRSWAALARLIGRDDLAELSRSERAERHDELDAAVSAWTARLEPDAAARACRACGVAAAPVLDEAGCYADAHLRARGAFRLNGSDDVPPTEFPDHLFRWDGPPLRWGPLCRLGADNDHVLRHVLGLDDAEVDALAAEGHLSLDYLQPDGSPW